MQHNNYLLTMSLALSDTSGHGFVVRSRGSYKILYIGGCMCSDVCSDVCMGHAQPRPVRATAPPPNPPAENLLFRRPPKRWQPRQQDVDNHPCRPQICLKTIIALEDFWSYVEGAPSQLSQPLSWLHKHRQPKINSTQDIGAQIVRGLDFACEQPVFGLEIFVLGCWSRCAHGVHGI